MNGPAEKLVFVSKTCLCLFTKNASSLLEAQRRFLTVEAIANSRPILHLDGKPISAFELAFGRPQILPPGVEGRIDPLSSFKKMQRRNKEMALVWSKQYLSKLARCDFRKGVKVQIGDVFLLPQSRRTRTLWPTGRVIDLKVCSDGFCRSVYLETSEGSTYWRPVKDLIPLPTGRPEAETEQSKSSVEE